MELLYVPVIALVVFAASMAHKRVREALAKRLVVPGECMLGSCVSVWFVQQAQGSGLLLSRISRMSKALPHLYLIEVTEHNKRLLRELEVLHFVPDDAPPVERRRGLRGAYSFLKTCAKAVAHKGTWRYQRLGDDMPELSE